MKNPIESFLDQLDQSGIRVALRNGKLEVKAPKGVFNENLKQKFSDNHAAIRAHLLRLADPIALLPEKSDGPAPLSPWQQGFWMMHIRSDSDQSVLKLPVMLRITGKLDVDRLSRAFDILADHHDVLRLRCRQSTDGGVEQLTVTSSPTLETVTHDIEKQDGAAASSMDVATAMLRHMTEDHMDLAENPPVRIRLLGLSQTEHYLLVVAHHLAFDGWSLNLLLQQLFQIYDNPNTELPPSKSFIEISRYYAQYWHRPEQISRIDQAAEEITDWPLCHGLPTDFKRGHRRSNAESSIAFQVPAPLCDALRSQASAVQGSLQTALLACLNILYWKLAGYERLSAMVPVSNRATSPILEDVMGCMANAVLPSLAPRRDWTVKDVLSAAARQMERLLEQQDLPFDSIVAQASHQRLPGTYPIVQIALALQDAASLPTSSSLSIELAKLPVINRQDFFVEFRHAADGGLDGNLHFDGGLFRETTARAFADAYLRILEQIQDNTEQAVANIACATPDKINKVAAPLQGAKQDNVETTIRYDAASALADHLNIPANATIGLDTASASNEINDLLEVLEQAGATLTKDIADPHGIDLLLSTNPQKHTAFTQVISVNHPVSGYPAILGTEADGLLFWVPEICKTNAFATAIPLRPGLTVTDTDGSPVADGLPGRLSLSPSVIPDAPRLPVAKLCPENGLQVQTDCLAATTGWVHGRYVDFDRSSQQILKQAPFADAALTVIEHNGRRELAAFVAEGGPSNHKVTDALVRDCLAPYAKAQHVGRLSALPRTADGQLDRHRLSLMPINAETVLKPLIKVPGTATVTTSKKSQPTRNLHLSDLLPKDGQAGLKALPVYKFSENNTELTTVAGKGRPALLVGDNQGEDYPASGWNPIEWTDDATSANRVLRCLDHDGRETLCNFADLTARAQRIADGLKDHNIQPGDVVILACRRPMDFLAGFFGAMIAGVTTAPVPHPRHWSDGDPGFDRLTHIARLTQAKAFIVNETISPNTDEGRFPLLTIAALETTTTRSEPHLWANDETMLVSFTSGSTGRPKGVPLAAECIWSQPRSFGPAMGFKPGETALNFTSLDHVASLVGFCCSALHSGCHLAVISIDRFLSAPKDVAQRLSDWKIARSWAPDFSWGIIADILNDIPEGKLDLSTLRALYSAGECPLDATYRRLNAALPRHGGLDVALRTSWGMAETTSLLTLSEPWDEESSHERANGVIDSGKVIAATEARIVSHDGKQLSEGEVGLFEVRGRQVFKSYIILDDNDQITTKCPVNDDGWMETGDLAYIANSKIVFLGRDNDVLVLNGQNVAQVAIEDKINLINGIEAGFSTVVATRDSRSGNNALIVFFCPENPYCDDAELLGLARAINNTVVTGFGASADHILPVEKKDIAKTGLGKIQRPRLRKAFEAGSYDHVVRRMDVLLRNERSLPAHFCQWQDRQIAITPLPPRLCPVIILVEDQLGLARATEKVLIDRGYRYCRVSRQDVININPDVPWRKEQAHLVDFTPLSADSDVSAADLMQRIALVRGFANDAGQQQRVFFVTTDPYGQRMGKSLAASLRHELKDLAIHSLRAENLVGGKDLNRLVDILCSSIGIHHHALTLHREGSISTPGLSLATRPGFAPTIDFPKQATVLMAGGTGAIGRTLIPQLLAWTDWSFICIGRRSAEAMTALPEARGGKDRLRYIQADAGDAANLAAALDGEKIDAVVNLTGEVRRTPLATLEQPLLKAMIDRRLTVAKALDKTFGDRSLPIVHLTSVATDFGPLDFTGYCLAVSAQQHWIATRQAQTNTVARHIELISGQWQADDGATDVNRYLEEMGFPLVGRRSGAVAIIRAILGQENSVLVGLDCQGSETAPYSDNIFPLDQLVVSGLTDGQGALAEQIRREAGLYRATVQFQEAHGTTPPATLNQTEQKILSLWRNLLPESAQVTPDANFFDIGGSSLLAARLQQGLIDLFGGPEDILTLFSHTTVRAQATLFSKAIPDTATAGPPARNAAKPSRRAGNMADRRRNARRNLSSTEALS